MNELQSTVARNRPGEEITLTVWRDRTERTLAVELMGDTEWLGDAAPAPVPAPETEPEPPSTEPQELEAWGVGLRDLTQREQSDFDAQAGAYVAYVRGSSPADQAGLPRDVVITRINDTAVRSAREAISALEEAAQGAEPYVLLQVQRRDGTPAFYEAPVPARP
jgi:S1-C subfamily serine protease